MRPAFDPHDEENWRGGYYEAAIVLGRNTAPDSDARLHHAITALWSSPLVRASSVAGLAGWDWNRMELESDRPLEDLHHIYGHMAHPTLGCLPFTSIVVREEEENGDDWLYAAVPLGGVEPSGGFPFCDDDDLEASHSWRAPLETTLAEVAMDVARSVDIQIAAIGFEISGIISADESLFDDAAPRRVGYITNRNGSIRYWPTNVWGPRP